MFQPSNDSPQLPTRRVVYPPGMARQRYAILREKPTRDRHLAYALLLIFLFQAFLLSCVALLLGALVLFSFINVISRAPEAEPLSVALTRVAALTGTPPGSDPGSNSEPATLPAPTNTVVLTVAPQEAPTADVVATPPPATEPPPEVVSPLAPPVDPPTQPVAPAEIQMYGNQVLPPIDQLSTALALLQGFIQNPNLNDQQWGANVTTQTAIIRNIYTNLQSVQPPPVAAALHNEFINTIAICHTAADSLDNAIATRNADALNTAVTYTQNCLASFPQANARVRDYITSASGQ